ncbi:hypothetical protein EWM64_g6342 [Hericium alpestre]|uniref:Protein kinase domain-containing protein n=1 Tax=Hericium alpestre TaxID=135208 RepID=A0A4Y9ZW04_9AGAM|nr:hypothetical protein EWM64_g6342 [Hericium alpestre]
MLGSTQGTRQHALSILVQDDYIQLWYFDVGGILRTRKEISILENFTTFAAVVVALCSLTPRQWGETQVVKDYELLPLGPDASVVDEFPRRSLTGGLVTFPDRRVYKLKDCIASQHTLVGRRTIVYSAMFHHREQGEDPSDKDLASKEVVVKLSYQVCERLHRLRGIGILHRDISVGNILCEERLCGKFDAIVNNFDLAIWIKADDSPDVSLANHRTGTLSFMALELLRKQTIQHRLRHDLESLFYVAVWWAVEKDSTDNHAARNALARWNQGPENKVAAVKRDFLENSFIESKLIFIGPYFVFGKSLQKLRETFRKVNSKLHELSRQEDEDQLAADFAERWILQQTSEREQTALTGTMEDDDIFESNLSVEEQNDEKLEVKDMEMLDGSVDYWVFLNALGLRLKSSSASRA